MTSNVFVSIVFTFIALVIGYFTGWIALKLLITIQSVLYWSVALLISYSAIYVLFKVLRRKNIIEDLFENVAISAIFIIGVFVMAPFGIYAIWKSNHTTLYIDNGLSTAANFEITNVAALKVKKQNYESIEVPIMPLEIKYNNEQILIPINNNETWVFNPNAINAYVEYTVKYISLLEKYKPKPQTPKIPDEGEKDNNFVIITNKAYFSTKADIILVEPSTILHGVDNENKILTVLERVKNELD